MVSDRRGFTIVEVLIAVIVLSVALLGLLGTTAMTIRVLGESDRTVTAAYYATQQLERLEALGCDAVSGGSDTQQGVSLTWTVGGATTDRTRNVLLIASYPLGRGRARADTFEKALICTR